ncbi:MAG: GyrI-like domain-containing protein [Trebonia sp.]
MNQEPNIQERSAQDFAGIRVTVTMDSIGSAIDQGFPELFGWLGGKGIAPAGPPFVRFLVIDMAADMQIELGVPVGQPVTGDTRIRAGVLPAGRYAVLRHIGPFDGDDGLIGANAALQDWASEHGIEFDATESAEGSVWGGRVEHYLTDPSQEPDPGKWETDVAYLTR